MSDNKETNAPQKETNISMRMRLNRVCRNHFSSDADTHVAFFLVYLDVDSCQEIISFNLLAKLKNGSNAKPSHTLEITSGHDNSSELIFDLMSERVLEFYFRVMQERVVGKEVEQEALYDCREIKCCEDSPYNRWYTLDFKVDGTLYKIEKPIH